MYWRNVLAFKCRVSQSRLPVSVLYVLIGRVFRTNCMYQCMAHSAELLAPAGASASGSGFRVAFS